MRVDFNLTRDSYRGLTTLGTLRIPGGATVQTLEDCVRGWGIKDGGNTAIPAGEYRLTVSMSQKFGRRMVMVYTESNKYEIKAGGIGFKGVRMHGGNSNKDTWGCIIVAKNRIGSDRVQESREVIIRELVDEYERNGFSVYLIVTNLKQSE